LIWCNFNIFVKFYPILFDYVGVCGVFDDVNTGKIGDILAKK